MKQIDFTGKFLGLNGKPVTDENGKELPEINIFLGNSLVMIRSDEPIRNIEIARKIYTDRMITLEEADKRFLLEQIKKLELPDLIHEDLRARIEK